MSQQSCQSCIIIIDSTLYKARFTDRNRGTIFPNYIFHNSAASEDFTTALVEEIGSPQTKVLFRKLPKCIA
jgi:hypothetical protein